MIMITKNFNNLTYVDTLYKYIIKDLSKSITINVVLNTKSLLTKILNFNYFIYWILNENTYKYFEFFLLTKTLKVYVITMTNILV